MVSVTIVNTDITLKFDGDFSPVRIQPDDSVMQLKKKILNELGIESRVSYHELYIYAQVPNSADLYKLFM